MKIQTSIGARFVHPARAGARVAEGHEVPEGSGASGAFRTAQASTTSGTGRAVEEHDMARDIRWGMIQSQHILRDGKAGLETLCGRAYAGQPHDLLNGKRSCESCLRLYAKEQDHKR